MNVIKYWWTATSKSGSKVISVLNFVWSGSGYIKNDVLFLLIWLYQFTIYFIGIYVYLCLYKRKIYKLIVYYPINNKNKLLYSYETCVPLNRRSYKCLYIIYIYITKNINT